MLLHPQGYHRYHLLIFSRSWYWTTFLEKERILHRNIFIYWSGWGRLHFKQKISQIKKSVLWEISKFPLRRGQQMPLFRPGPIFSKIYHRFSIKLAFVRNWSIRNISSYNFLKKVCFVNFRIFNEHHPLWSWMCQIGSSLLIERIRSILHYDKHPRKNLD